MELEFLNQLNPMQREACLHTEGPLLILAGAGSGKTRVLTYRIANLLSKGVSPFNIIAVTFTNKAADEMKERVIKLEPYGKNVWVSTFHSACVRILRREIHHIGYENQFTVYDAEDALRLVKNCVIELNLSEKLFPPKAVMQQISKFKDELLSPSEVVKDAESDFRLSTVAQIYKLYQKKLKRANSLDFDDIITKTVELFILRPDILERYQERFKYIMVDEYQDTNAAQYHFVRLLADKYRNICVVGDDDQSIYGWRGANIKNILEFEKRYEDAKVVKLEQNYRSTKTILGCANSVIRNNKSRKSKKLWTDGETGEKAVFFNADSDYDEAQYIVDEIKGMAGNGFVFSDFAVLYRINATSRVLEEAFVKNSLPYRVFGGVNFYGRREIKDIMAYLKLIYNKYDSVSFERIINVPRRGIGPSSIDKIKDHAAANDMHMFDAARDFLCIEGLGGRAGKIRDFVSMIGDFIAFSESGAGVEALIRKILEVINYKNELLGDEGDDAQERIENIDALIAKAHEYDASAEEPSLAGFLEEVSLVADIDNLNENDDAVVLMTLHNCKGLEFPCVFIAGFEEGLLPGYRSINSENPSELEEERRICYVGMTRAKKKLYLTAAKKRMQAGFINYNLPSRFYDEIDKSLMDVIKPGYSRNEFSIRQAADAEGTAGRFKSGAFTGQEPAYGQGGTNAGRIIAGAVPGRKPMYGQNTKSRAVLSAPKNVTLDFEIGDMVSQAKYGIGEVLDIYPAGADYEVTVKFKDVGIKKFMAGLARLKKV